MKRTIALEEASFSSIDPHEALDDDAARRMRPQTYVEIQRLSADPSNTAFQDLFVKYYGMPEQFYPLDWQERYFEVFADVRRSGSFDIESILLKLLGIERNGKTHVELSFASKMLATLDPEHAPIWDNQVMTALRRRKLISVKDTGVDANQPPEDRIAPAIENYRRLCAFYERFAGSDKAGQCIVVFDSVFPEYADKSRISDLKKLDFILWRLGK